MGRNPEIAALYQDMVYNPEGFQYMGHEVPKQLLKCGYSGKLGLPGCPI